MSSENFSNSHAENIETFKNNLSKKAIKMNTLQTAGLISFVGASTMFAWHYATNRGQNFFFFANESHF